MPAQKPTKYSLPETAAEWRAEARRVWSILPPEERAGWVRNLLAKPEWHEQPLVAEVLRLSEAEAAERQADCMLHLIGEAA